MDLYSMLLPQNRAARRLAGVGAGMRRGSFPSSTSLQGNEVPAEKRLDGGGGPSPPSPPFEGGGSRRRACSRWSCREGFAYEVAALDMHTGDGGTGIGNKNKSQTNK